MVSTTSPLCWRTNQIFPKFLGIVYTHFREVMVGVFYKVKVVRARNSRSQCTRVNGRIVSINDEDERPRERMNHVLRWYHLISHTVNRQNVSRRGKIFPDDGCVPTREFTQVPCCNSRDNGPSRDGNLPIKITVLIQLERWCGTFRKQ